MKKFTGLLICILFGSTLWGSAVARITSLSGQATLARGTNNLPAKLGAALEIKDTVITAKDAKAQLTFSDNTIITVGKQSKFSVEDYLDDNTPSSSAKFNMVSGTIRAMSGKIGKIAPEKFTVKTKTATIGIRGTDFIVHVLPTGELVVLCMQGNIIVSPTQNTKNDSSTNETKGDAQAQETKSESSNQTINTEDSVIIPAGSFVTVSNMSSFTDVKEFTPAQLNGILNNGLDIPAPIPTKDAAVVAILPVATEATASPQMMTLSETPLPVINVAVVAADTGTTLVTNTSGTIAVIPEHFVGYAVGGFIAGTQYTLSPTGTVDFTSDPGSSSVSGSLSLEDTNSIPFWRGNVNSVQSPDYIGADTFSVAIDSFTTNLITDPIASTSLSHVTTVADTADDYFAYGFWQVDPMVVSSTGTPLSVGTYSGGGYWAAGVPTPMAMIDGFRSAASTLTYTGTGIGDVAILNGTTILSFSTISSGTVIVNVNFGNDTFQQNAAFTTAAGDNYILNGSGNVAGTQVIGNAISAFTKNTAPIAVANGAIQGGFYGPTGNIVGGTFGASGSLAGNVIVVQGAFKATAP